jgi:hypothetical protein
MPFRKLKRLEAPEEEKLRTDLKAEMRNPKDTGEPEIVMDRPYAGTVHLYVIWSEWGDLDQMIRSRIILDAYTEAFGKEECDKVTVAMGMTKEEAARFGLKTV